MKEMRSFWKTYGKNIVIVFVAMLVLILGGPLIINWLYKQPAIAAFFETNWGAEDVLDYYGSILGSLIGAAATILVLLWTIRFTVKNQKDERKLSVRPYLEISKYHITDLDKLNNAENTVFLEISNGVITYQAVIPERIVKLKKLAKDKYDKKATDVMEEVISDLSVNTFFAHNYVLQLDIHNNGAGNAIDVDYKMNGRSIMFPFCVTTEKMKRLVCIFHDDLIESDRRTLSFVLEYGDVASLAKYQQKENMDFYRDLNGNLATAQCNGDFLTKPIEITNHCVSE